jgi:TonB-dependent receptor
MKKPFPPRLSAFRLLSGIIIMLVAGARLAAQTASGTIEGRVLDPASGDYLLNARVSVKDAGKEAFTDSAGYYQIRDVTPGTVTLEVFYTGFDPQTATVVVEAGRTAGADFSLRNVMRYGDGATVIMDKFVVAATREEDAQAIAVNEQRFADNVKNVVAADAFGDIAEGNIGEFMKFIPGVSLEYGAGDASALVLRGIPSEYNAVTMDGNELASTAGYGAGRAFSLEQVSIVNAARVEVVKSQLPSNWANALGGGVNLVSKSSFERSKPQLKYKAFMTFSSDDYDLGKTGGPGDKQTRKVRPGGEFSYIKPVTKNFGFTVSALYSDQVGHERYSTPTWEFRPTYGASETNPYLRNYQLRDDPRETERQSVSLGVDWKPFTPLTLKLNYTYSSYDLFTAVNRLSFQHRTVTGAANILDAAPTDYDEHHMHSGKLNNGAETTETLQSPMWRKKYGDTHTVSGAANWRLGAWKASVEGSFSKSVNYYRDTDHGFFSYADVRISQVQTNFDDIQKVRPGTITVSKGGEVKDWTKLASYNIINVESEHVNSADTRYNARANLRRDIRVGGVDGAVQVGVAYKKQIRDRSMDKKLWSYRGADGVADNADNTAAGIVNENYLDKDMGFGWPTSIEWVSLSKLYDLYQEHEDDGWFVPNATHAYQQNALGSEYIEESIYGAYLQAEATAFRGRMKVVGGVRFEQTENRGEGLLREGSIYITRGQKSSTSYGGWYPSVGVNYNITGNLISRAAYGRTVGRPNFTNIIGRAEIIESTETISIRNPNLKPWEADNIDLSLEYYLKSGVISVGAFWKNIDNAFGTSAWYADEALLDEFELSHAYIGWDMTTTRNVGKARVSGIEVNFSQRLNFKSLPRWARGFSVFANGTWLDLDGERADFNSFVEKIVNWGISYSYKRLSARLNWNYRGKQHINYPNFGVDADENPILAEAHTLPVTRLDANIEFRFTKWLALFFNGRDITHADLDRVKISANNPEYSQFYQRNKYSIKFTAGIRGTW